MQDKEVLPGSISLERDHLTGLSSSIYSQRYQNESFTVKTSFDNSTEINKVECVYSLSF